MTNLTRMKILTTGATASAPSTIKTGELAYSYVPGTQVNNGDRLYIGSGTEVQGVAPDVHIVGGKYFTDLLSHMHGITTVSSALVVDINSHISDINVSNLRVGVSGSTDQVVTSISTDGTFSDSTDSELVTASAIKFYVDNNITAADLDFAGDTGSGAVDLDSQALTIVGTADEVVTSAVGQTLKVGLPADVTINHDLLVRNDLTVLGTTTTVNSEEIVIQDPIITLGGSEDHTQDDMLDRGILFRYYDAEPVTGFFGLDNSSGRFIFTPKATETNEVISGEFGDIEVGGAFISDVKVGVTDDNTIDTGTADLILDSATGTVVVPNTLQVTTLELTNDLGVAHGGTGMSAFTAKGVFVANTAGDGLEFLVGVEGDLLQFGATGAPYVSAILDGGTY